MVNTVINTAHWLQRTRKRKDLLLLMLIWAAVEIYLLATNGIKIDGEAARVIREANNLINTGHFSAPNFFLYFTEIALVYLKIKLGFGFGVIIFIQLLLNLIALNYLYKFMLDHYASARLAMIGCILFLLCFPHQLYNSFLYTESIFFSLSVIYSCYLLNTVQFNSKRIIVLLSLLLLLCITRPTGIFFLGASIIYIFSKLSGRLSLLKRTAIFIGLAAAGLFILNMILGMGGGIDIILPFREEHIICGEPTVAAQTSINESSNNNSLAGLFYYITHNFSQFSRLAWLKTKAFFGLTRPFYSTAHNIFITAYFYPLYIFIVLAIARFRKAIPVSFVYFISITLIFWLSVVFSCDEWHNRFFLGLTPFLIIPALYLFTKKKEADKVN